MDAVWRIQARHRIEASYAEINRSRTLAPGTSFGQEESGGENPLRLNQRSRFARAAYGYSLVNTAQKELGVLLGLHWPRLQATINGESGRVLDEVDAKAPMFSLGVYGRLAMRRGFEALLRAEAAGLDIGQYDGRVFDARGLLAWNPRDGFALLAGYGWQITRLDGYTEGFRGRFDQRTHGPLIGLRLTF